MQCLRVGFLDRDPRPVLKSSERCGWIASRLVLPTVLLGLLATRDWRLVHPYAEHLQSGQPPYLTVFLVDGLSQSVFQAELAAGRLPQMQRLLEEGAYVQDGITAFPSMTGYAFFPLLTGHDATESGVLGLRWFDREAACGNFRNYVGRTSALMNRDFSAKPLTLFECFPDQRTSSINSFANRGVQRSLLLGWAFTMAKYHDFWWLPRALASLPVVGRSWAPDWQGAEEQVLERAISDLAYRPKIQWITFASPDAYHHLNGMGPPYVQLLHQVDTLIGRYRAASLRLGLEQRRVYAVLSDHGVVDVKVNVDLAATLSERHGLRIDRDQATYVWDSELTAPLERYLETDGILAVNGNTMNYLYFRNSEYAGLEGWKHRLESRQLRAYPGPGDGAPVDLVAKTLAVEGVELVVYRGPDGSVELESATGAGQIQAGARGFSYKISGTDPLNYLADPAAAPLVGGQPHSADAWLLATHSSEYPYAVVRLHRLLSCQDSGDLVVTARAGYDLARDFEMFVGNYRGGHGGLRADQLRVPYILSGPGVPRGLRIATASAEDIGATLFQLLRVAPEVARPDGPPLFGASGPLIGLRAAQSGRTSSYRNSE